VPALVLALLAAGAGAALSACGGGGSPGTGASAAAPASAFEGAALPSPAPAPALSLTDEQGRTATLREYRGHPLVIAFLYAGCTPACVLVAQQIRGALDELAQPVPVLFVSVDPGADTPARVRAFLRAVSLEGRVRYLNGPPRALAGVWSAYRIATPAAGRARFERTITVVLLDAQGRERVLYQQEQLTPDALAHDIRVLEAG